MIVRHRTVKDGGPSISRAYHWTEAALCGSAPERDKQTFTGAFPTLDIARDIARRYCNQCPVKSECLNWAYDDWAFTGIAGGMAFVGEKASGRNRRAVRINTED